MPAYKDKKTKKWYVSFYYDAESNVRKKKLKRGFETKHRAQEWEREFLRQSTHDLGMTFKSFVELYTADMKQRLKENSFITKETIINKTIMPYFQDKRLGEITAKDVIKWQNDLMTYRQDNGKGYSATYLATIHNQLSAIFNHAVRFYDLAVNPAAKAGNMGESHGEDTPFWTKDEYLTFSGGIADKPMSYIAFEVLYWCGIRMGELLALTPNDFDFKNGLLHINKSYQRISGRDVITEPKTKKSVRIIKMPDFLCEEVARYLNENSIPKLDRIFPVTKSFLHHEMNRGVKKTGVKRIKIHGLRHSHISHLIDLGFSAVAIADRVGHESINITYRYAHLFPSKQTDMAQRLNAERGDFNGAM